MGEVLLRAERYADAERCYEDAFDKALKNSGPRSDSAADILRQYIALLYMQPSRRGDAEALALRAEALGCDISAYVY